MLPDEALPIAPNPPSGLCNDLVALESSALVGGLLDEQMTCLEQRFVGAVRQTERRKVSLLLITKAHGRGDKRAWQSMVMRHL
jgi:hypothetical protein